VAVTVTLAIGAGVFARSLIAALRLNPSIDTAHIVTGSISLTQYGYTAPRAAAFFEDLRRRLGTSGAVTSVSIAHSRGGMSAGGQIEIDGVRREMPAFVSEMEVDSNYFRTLGVPLLRGRTFSADDRMSGPLVIMVSAAFGDFIAPGGEPVGHHVTESRSRPPNPPPVGTIVGVVPDVIRSVTDTRPMVRYYTSSQGEPAFSALIVLRTADDASTAISDLERAVKAIDPRVSSGPWLTMEQQLGRQMNPQRFGIFVLGSLAVIALVLTGLGIYVVAASMAAGRRREMTIRSALGASRASIGGLIVRETAWLVGGGTAGGLVLAWSGARTIRTLLFRVEPLDPLTIVATVASVILVSLLVTLRPAVGAGRCDLAQVLREE
jgi:hypothetical protein